MPYLKVACDARFQSAPPVRGAIELRVREAGADDRFNPRPPCGGRSAAGLGVEADSAVSIRAPRAGGDLKSLVILQNL